MNNDMNYDEITVGDCLEQFEYKNETVLLNDGKVAEFVKNEEKIGDFKKGVFSQIA
jgi:hypothetical protein